MRVLMVLDKPFRTDLRVEREVRALTAADHRVTLLCQRTGAEPEVDQWEGAEVHRVDIPHGRSARWRQYATATVTGRSWLWERNVRSLAGSEPRFDVLHCHDLPVALSGARAARWARTLFVFDRHENWPGLLAALQKDFPSGLRKRLLWSTINNPALWRYWEKKVIQAADLVITVSDEATDELPSLPKKVQVVSNYVDIASLPKPTPLLPMPPLRACFAGVFNAMFGLAETVRAMSLLEPGVAELVLVGDGDNRAELERLVSELGVADRVRLTGWRPREDAIAAIQQAHLCLLPLRDNALTRTTIGNKLFEYMALERAVLCSGVGVMARIVRESQAGVVVDPWSASTLADELRALARSPEKLAGMGRSGREAVLSRYNWGRERQGLLSGYESLRRLTPRR